MPETKLPSIPNVPSGLDPQMQSFMSAVKEMIEVWAARRGDKLDKVVTFRDLDGVEMVRLYGKTPILDTSKMTVGTAITANSTQEDLTPPPNITDLVVTGGYSNVFLEWTVPTYGNHSHTEILRAETSNVGQAQIVGQTPGGFYVDSLGYSAKRYYWVRAVSSSGVKGNIPTLGIGASAVADPTYLQQVMAGKILWAPGVTYPAGTTVSHAEVAGVKLYQALLESTGIEPPNVTYWTEVSAQRYVFPASSFYIVNPGKPLQIPFIVDETGTVIMNSAVIKDGSIDNAKIGNLSADKITTGQMSAARVNAASLSALSANMGNLTSGTITIDSTGFIRGGQSNYDTGNGFWLGYDTADNKYKISMANVNDDRITFDQNGTRIKGNLKVESLSAEQANKVINGDFATNLANWYVYGNAVHDATEGFAAAGSIRHTSGAAMISRYFSVTPGDKLVVIFAVRASSKYAYTGYGPFIVANFKNVAPVDYIDSYSATAAVPIASLVSESVASIDWQLIEREITVPAGCNYASLELDCEVVGTPGQQFWFDDFVVRSESGTLAAEDAWFGRMYSGGLPVTALRVVEQAAPPGGSLPSAFGLPVIARRGTPLAIMYQVKIVNRSVNSDFLLTLTAGLAQKQVVVRLDTLLENANGEVIVSGMLFVTYLDDGPLTATLETFVYTAGGGTPDQISLAILSG